MLPELTKGALDSIMSGEEVTEPILQFLGYKKLVSSSGEERYRLLISDGVKSNSFTMLGIQLKELITKDVLSALSIFQIKRYAITTVKNHECQRPVMVILDIDVLVPGHEVGKVLGDVDEVREEKATSDASCQTDAVSPTQSSDKTDEGGQKHNNSLYNFVKGIILMYIPHNE